VTGTYVTWNVNVTERNMNYKRNIVAPPNIIRVIEPMRIRWAGHVTRMGEMGNTYMLAGKPEGKRPLGRRRHKWKDHIRMDLWKIWLGGVDWMHLAQGREQWWALMNKVMNLWVP